MRYLSVCAGIEAATQGWHHLGWEPVAFSEIEPFPSAVLKHHYPNVPNWGDMTQYKTWPDATIDLLVGGTPCQSFSVAGLRKGLEDPRGNLMLTFLGLADRQGILRRAEKRGKELPPMLKQALHQVAQMCAEHLDQK
jgi:DNA (cytosine-5)-methyltransferase 1